MVQQTGTCPSTRPSNTAQRVGLLTGCAVALGLASLHGCGKAPIAADQQACNSSVDQQDCLFNANGSSQRLGCDKLTGRWTILQTCEGNEVCQVGLADAVSVSQVSLCAAVTTVDGSSGYRGVKGLDGGGTEVDGISSSDVSGNDATADSSAEIVASTGCGDGICQAGEDASSCPGDCGSAGVISGASCAAAFCPGPYQQCANNPACVAAYNSEAACLSACGATAGCFASCATSNSLAFALANCAYSHCLGGAGCGDGTCSAAESVSSCPADCAKPGPESCVGHCGGNSDTCHCEANCSDFGNCCADFSSVCHF